MASAKFLEEALSTDVDESAVSAIVGSLENQLVTSTPPASSQTGSAIVINQNHVNSAISNGGTVAPQKHGTIANGDSISGVNAISANDGNKQVNNANAMLIGTNTGGPVTTSYVNQSVAIDSNANKPSDGVKLVYSQGNQVMSNSGTIIQTRVTLPNGTIGGLPPQTVLQTTPTNVQTIQNKQPTLVLKSSGAPGATGLVTVPMNVASSMGQANNGTLLIKTENGQYQLLRLGPAPPQGINSSQAAGQPVTFRMQTVQASTAATNPVQAGATTTVTSAAQPVVHQGQVGQVQVQVQRPANDNTKEKCRKFLANLLELSSREPKSVERNVRQLIQELIDNKVEPEDFCDKLERLLNASPQPCLIGFLKKSLPLLRHSLATQELSIDGIRPPPTNVVFSIAGATPTVQTIRPAGIQANQVRIVTPGTTVVRPGQVIQQRLVTPIRAPAAQPTRMVTSIRQPIANNVIVSSSQPPALHPVYPNGQQVRTGLIRQPVQVRTLAPSQIRQQMPVRPALPLQKQLGAIKQQGTKPTVPSNLKPLAKDKEKKTFSSAYTGDDDINDVAAMGGVNLAEETQKILGSTEFVGTQIRSCKEEVMCSMPPLQQRIRQAMAKHGLDEPGTDVAACISHAAQERLRDLIEKLSVISEHRLDNIKTNTRYDITNDIKGQLKFLEDLDKAERKRHEEMEREVLMRAAKSRSRTEDPEQAKLKAKAKEMQRVEMEELRQREANATALQAIGPRKKPRMDGELANTTQSNVGGPGSGIRGQLPLRQRMKKVTLRDIQFLFETEKDLCKSHILYKSYLK
ncbi:transcription initiation factor TFIID subunit 4 isoform X3 [Diabrotica virgifera virgifera]|uniref:Transcription initiation factor TFIID subunit 4 isoform X4 n=1 Tax=Diabrotica virgifera virgifera TaxID=50390 RepID=A0A6P7FCM9_DIAVI|nr:transcription initiation factor TFIID subunit 4 isoform X3 [Diabrotica virgifera virgifera]